MNAPTKSLYRTAPNRDDSHAVLTGLRDLFSHNPEAVQCGAETLANLLRLGRFLRYRPAVVEVEAALEVLDVERGAA